MDTPLKNNKEDIFLLCYIVLLTGILLVDKVLLLPVGIHVYTFLFALFLWVAGKFRSVVYLICFLIPLYCTLDAIAYILLLTNIALLAYKRFTISKKTVYLLLYFCLLELFAHFLYKVSDTNRMGGYILTVFTLIFLIQEDLDADMIDYKKCINLYLLGTYTLFLLMYLNASFVLGSGLADALSENVRLGESSDTTFETMSIVLNANSLAYYSALAISLYFSQAIYYKQHNIRYHYIYLVGTLFSVFIGAMTVSRSWLATMALLVILFFLSIAKSKQFIPFAIGALTLGAVLIYYLLEYTEVFYAFDTRFTQEDASVSSNSRSIIFSDYNEIFSSNWKYILFGTGVTDYVQNTRMWQSMHNGFQQIIICLGIPSAIVFLSSIMIPVLNREKTELKLIYWIPWIILIFFTQSIQFLNPYMLMLPYIITVFSLRKNNPDRMESQKNESQTVAQEAAS